MRRWVAALSAASVLAAALVAGPVPPAGAAVSAAAPDPAVELRVRVRGTSGQERYTVVVDGVPEGERTAGTAWATVSMPLTGWPTQVEVRFTNDQYVNGVDRNLVVDWIEVADRLGDQRIPSSDPAVLSTGVYRGSGCETGHFGTGELACNGSLFYPVPPAVWQPSALQLPVTVGQVQAVSATLTVRAPVLDPTVVVSGGVTGWVGGIGPIGQDLAVGTYRVELAVAPPRRAAPGDVAVGYVTLRAGGQDAATLALAVTAWPVVPERAATVPALPAPDRTAVAAGVTYVTDEIVVAADADAPDPDRVARTVADALDGHLIGAVPAARLYQVRLPQPVALGVLAGLRAVAEAVPGVASAGLHVFSTVSAVPDDPLWSSWTLPEPGTNNRHLRQIGAPAAWDVTTGSSRVGVGVVDGGFDPAHEDLGANLISLDGGLDTAGSGHATLVAGTACADGNNQVGLSGVAWHCALRGYEARVPGTRGSIDELLAAQGMAQAALDGTRVVNLSFGVEGGIPCVARAGPDYQVLASSAADQLAQAMDVARAAGRDVLWVKAAGDGGCTAATDPELGLTDRFPANYLTVASVSPAGTLSSFTDRGAPIRIAAPAEAVPGPIPARCELFTLPCTGSYATRSGTSLAAPQVSGAAALLFAAQPRLSAAQAAECLIRAAGADPVGGQPFGVLDIPGALACAATNPLGLPPLVDLVFAVDRSATMGAPLARFESETTAVAAELRAAAPGTDFHFGLVSLGDYPDTQDVTACGSTYGGPYGEPGDVPYRLDHPLTPDAPSVQDALGDLASGLGTGPGLGSGFVGDRPGAYARALLELAQPDQAGAIGWRPGAARITVLFGDRLPHGTDLRLGFGDGPLAPADVPDDTGPDAGRDGQVCTGDDVDLHTALSGLRRTGNRLLMVESSGRLGPRQAWARWTAHTGGAIALADPSGLGPGGASLADTVTDLIGLTSGLASGR